MKKNIVDYCVPSESWVNLQFSPSDPYSAAAVRYTGRFPIHLKVQSRSLRKFSFDAHYMNAFFKYLKSLAVLYRPLLDLFCLDDKNNIKVGPAGHPISSLMRNKKVLVLEGNVPLALDHDYGFMKLSPSVFLRVSVPDTLEGSFYNGTVSVVNRDVAFDPSSAKRAASDLISVMDKSSLILPNGNYIKPMLALKTDGGPERRTSFVTVRLGNLALFKQLNLDVLIVMRTAAGQSFVNPAEKVMCVLNLGLYGTSFSRLPVDDAEFESRLASIGSMDELRDLCNTNERKEMARASLAPVIDAVDSRFAQLTWFGEHISVFKATPEEDVQKMLDTIKSIDESLNWDAPIMKDFMKSAGFSAFWKAHVIVGEYVLQYIKCGKDDCLICEPVRNPEAWTALKNGIPFPELDDSQLHYKKFEELFGERNVELLPSKLVGCVEGASASDLQLDSERSKIFTGARVRMVIECEECSKWRCVFSEYTLPRDQKAVVDRRLEEFEYCCGLPLFLTSLILYKLLTIP